MKTQTTNQIQIKYVSKILWSRYKKTRQDDIDQQTCYTENFWKYCENTFQPQGYIIKPECYQTPVINVSKEAFQNHPDLLYWHGSHLTFQQMNSILRNQHLEKLMPSEKSNCLLHLAHSTKSASLLWRIVLTYKHNSGDLYQRCGKLHYFQKHGDKVEQF